MGLSRNADGSAVDAWLASLDRIEEARLGLIDALVEIQPSIPKAAEDFASGVPMSQIVKQRSLPRRQRVLDAVAEMTSALAESRVATILVMVERERMTMKDIADLYGIPRQIVSRLYHAKRS